MHYFVCDYRAALYLLPEVKRNSYIITCSKYNTRNYSIALKRATGLLPKIPRYLILLYLFRYWTINKARK